MCRTGRGSGTRTQEGASTAPGLTLLHEGKCRGGGGWRWGGDGCHPAVAMGAAAGTPPQSRAQAGRKWRTIGENQAGRPGLAVPAVPLRTSLAAVSPSAASPRGAGPWALLLLLQPGSPCHPLGLTGWRPFVVYWGQGSPQRNIPRIAEWWKLENTYKLIKSSH